MVEYDIINETNEELEDITYLEDVIKTIFKNEKVEKAIFNIIIVDNEKIRYLNKTYRNKDTVTDVISFALEDHKDNIKTDMRILGDIFISLDKTKEQKDEYGHSFKRELSFLVTHGLFHLLGYDHMNDEDEKIMNQKTEEVLNENGIYR